MALAGEAAGWLDGENIADFGVYEANDDTGDEVLDKEAGEGVGKLSIAWLPALIEVKVEGRVAIMILLTS